MLSYAPHYSLFVKEKRGRGNFLFMITIKINIFFFAQRRPPLIPSPPPTDGRECLPKEKRTKKKIFHLYLFRGFISVTEEYLEAIFIDIFASI